MVSFRDDLQQHEFRGEVQAFLYEAMPNGFHPGDDQLAWLKKLKARGWFAPAWPVMYGGAGMSVVEQFILNEELALRRAPRPELNALGLAGPTIMAHGTDE